MGDRITATAIVTLTIEVEAKSAWGRDCSVAQIEDQASRETVAALHTAVKNSRLVVRIDDAPVVKAVITRGAS